MEYINHAFRKKYEGSLGIALCLSGFVLYFLVVTTLNRFSSFEGLAGLSYGIILFLYGIVALEGSKIDLMVFSLIWVVIALVRAYIMFGILGIVTGEGIGALLARSGNIRTYSALAAGALKFSMGRVVLAAHKKKAGSGADRGLGDGMYVPSDVRLGAGYVPPGKRGIITDTALLSIASTSGWDVWYGSAPEYLLPDIGEI